MRVIGGSSAAATAEPVPGMETRPTPDRLRESLFSILAPRLGGATFVDAYAGTGAVGIEALSRALARVIFIERARAGAARIAREPGIAEHYGSRTGGCRKAIDGTPEYPGADCFSGSALRAGAGVPGDIGPAWCDGVRKSRSRSTRANSIPATSTARSGGTGW